MLINIKMKNKERNLKNSFKIRRLKNSERDLKTMKYRGTPRRKKSKRWVISRATPVKSNSQETLSQVFFT